MSDAKTTVKTDAPNNKAGTAEKSDVQNNEARTAAKADTVNNRAGAAVKADMTQKEKEYEIAMLRKNSMKLFGVTTSTFDGAMSRQTEPISITDAKELIEKWKKGDAH